MIVPLAAVPARWRRARATAAPALAVLGTIVLSVDAVRDILGLRAAAARSAYPHLFAGMYGAHVWILVLAAVGLVCGLLLIRFRRGARRAAASVMLIALGAVVCFGFGMAINSLPFMASGVIGFLPNDPRLHAEETA